MISVVVALVLSAIFPFAQSGQPAIQFTDVTKSAEVQAYVKRAIANNLTDQQIRQVSIGKANVGVAVVHRPRLSTPAVVAEHDLVSEVYHVISGGGTIRISTSLSGFSPPSAR